VAVSRPGDLYVVAVGANRFPAFDGSNFKKMTLGYAAADARAIADELGRNDGHLYRQVIVDVIADDLAKLPTKAAIIAALGGLRRAGADDTVVVFLASHGISDRAGNYYMLPRDGQPADLLSIIQRGDQSGTLPSLLSWQDIFDALRQAAGRRVLVVDTCQAGDVTAERMSHTLRKRSAASSFALMLASLGDEQSQEFPERGHGVFTYGVLQALEGNGPADTSARITVAAAFDYARRVVAEQRPRKDLPQTPQMLAPAGLGDVALAQVRRHAR
jgi:uncharacterized caspase-like protein